MDLLWSSILAGMTSGTPGDVETLADDADVGGAGDEAVNGAAMLAREES